MRGIFTQFIIIYLCLNTPSGYSDGDQTCLIARQKNIFCDITQSLEKPTFEAAPESPIIFHAHEICINKPCILITGDTQYPRTGSKIDEFDEAKAHLTDYFNAIKQFSESKGEQFVGIIINGDITEFGHPDQIQFMQSMFGLIKKPIWFGLGNHDYINNTNDCWMNRCTSGSLDWLISDVLNKYDSILSSDYIVRDVYEFPTSLKEYIGSFAYKFSAGGITFIQLNNDDTRTFKTERAFNASKAQTTFIYIQPSLQWAKAQLEESYAKKEPVIILSHTDELSGYLKAHSIRNNVTAHYFGHWHNDPSIIYRDNCGSMGGDSILSGTAFQGSGLIVEIDKENKVLNNYAFLNNNLNQFKLLKKTEIK